MVRPSRSYQEAKANARALLTEAINDTARVSRSLPLAEVRRLFHHHGLDFYLEPILRDLVDAGLITVWREDRKGIIYLTEEWRGDNNAVENQRSE